MSEDLGAAEPGLAAALLRYEVQPEPQTRDEVLQRLRSARVFLAAVPTADGSEVQTPTFQGKDGRTASLVFTSLAELTAWNEAARPLPQAASFVARDCLRRQTAALIVDFASPHRFVVQGIELAVVAATEG